MQPGWLDVARWRAAYCWCVLLHIYKTLFTRCQSLMSVSPQWEEARWRGVAERLGSNASQKQAHTTVELEWWEKERNVERLLWLNVSESNRCVDSELCGSSLGLNGTNHMVSPWPFQITISNFDFMLRLSCHDPKMTRRRGTKHCYV